MTRAAPRLKAVTANSLRDGDVVFLDPRGGWTRAIEAAATFDDAAALEAALATGARAVADTLVVGVYAIDVARDGLRVIPSHIKERIRAAGGPTMAVGPAASRSA